MNCFVGGIGGVGKTTILKGLKGSFRNCEIIHGSQVLFESFSLPVGDYEALHALPSQLKDQVFDRTVIEILDQRQNGRGHLLLDAHYLNFVEERASCAVGEWIARMDVLILIEADADIILDRLKADLNRLDRQDKSTNYGRNLEERLSLINRFLVQSRKEAQRLSVKYGIPLRLIDNSDGIALAVEALAGILRHPDPLQA